MSDAASVPRMASESIAGQRPYQEDAVLIETLPDGRTLVAVADGMGGHAAGEVASALALETLVEAVTDGRNLKEAFSLANERVHAKARDPGKQGMGTTLVAMLLDGDSYTVANVGDSRGYLLSATAVRQITEDHSFVAEAVKRGESEDEMLASQWKDALTRSIGGEPEVDADLFGPFSVDPDTAVLLCSDGLYKTLSDDDVLALFLRSGGPRAASQTLASTALEKGSDDNISVVIAEFGEVRRDQPAGTMPLEWTPPEGHPESSVREEDAEAEQAPAQGKEEEPPPRKKKKRWWPFGGSS